MSDSTSEKSTGMMNTIKGKLTPLLAGVFILTLFSFLGFVSPKPIAKAIALLENLTYDVKVRNHHKPLGSDSSVTIVAIDDKSLKEQGRWPWQRKILAELVTKLYKAGAVIVALDATFPDAENNTVMDVVKEFKNQPGDYANVIAELDKLKPRFDYDEQFSKSLALGDSVLGVVFSEGGEISGVLPPPLLKLSHKQQNELAIPNKGFYLANIPLLQKAAKNGGFINATKDDDGVLRFTNLLMRHDDNVYGSLSLQAVSLYLMAKKTELITEEYGTSSVLEGVKLDELTVPTDPLGRILIPYRGPAFTFPYVSAADVIAEKADRSLIDGKLIFIGFSASALGDLYATSVAPVYPGVEIHATVASGIIDHYLPYKPYWGKGVISCVILLSGLICVIFLPFCGALASTLICFTFIAILVAAEQWLWWQNGIVLSTLLPVLMVFCFFIFNLAWGYYTESKRGKELKSIFGQYVPPAYLDEMIKKGGEINLDGESKELSVLFSDIRSFTSLSEKMSASVLKKFLNKYFNPVTEAIFNNHGTIDKYVGDMVMAFWGAPAEDPRHAFHAVTTALEMQAKLAQVNMEFQKDNKPNIAIGIGINTGLMNVGDMGSKFRRSYTVIGDAVNLASRLEGQTKYYHIDILVGETTWLRTNKEFVYRKIDKIKVKGKDTGTEVFQPLCHMKDLTPDLTKELEIHHQALDAYFNQDWDTASKLFEALKTSYPIRAGLDEVYLRRIASMRLRPYIENWDGSYMSLDK